MCFEHIHGFLQHKNQCTVKTTEAPVETEHGQDYWVSSVETRISAAIATVKTTGAPVETEHGQDYWVSSVETRITELYPRYTPATWGSGPGETTKQLLFPREGLRSPKRRHSTALNGRLNVIIFKGS